MSNGRLILIAVDSSCIREFLIVIDNCLWEGFKKKVMEYSIKKGVSESPIFHKKKVLIILQMAQNVKKRNKIFFSIVTPLPHPDIITLFGHVKQLTIRNKAKEGHYIGLLT